MPANNPPRLSKQLEPPSGVAIETFSDLLADAQDLAGIGQTALQFTLETIGHNAGVLIAQTSQENEPVCITQQNLPTSWLLQLDDPLSPLRKIMHKVVESGEYVTGDAATQQLGVDRLAAAIPVSARSGVQGALLVEGETCSPIEVDWMMKLCRPLGRAIRLSRASQVGATSPQAAPASASPEPPLTQSILQAVLENLPGYIYIIGNQFELIAANAAIARRAGQDLDNIIGQLCYQALYQRSEPCQNCMVSETLTKGKGTLRTTVRQRNLDDDIFSTLEIRSYPVVNRSGQVVYAALFEQDITDQREMEAIVAQSGKLAALGQLAAGVAHEINNPLTAIIANAQILQREIPAGDDRLESVNLIAMAGARAAQVVRNLLDFARKEQSERVLTNVNETLRMALALVQHEMLSHSIQLQFTPDETLPFILVAPDSLQGVWLNLLLNAIESIDRQPGMIRIASWRLGDDVHISISDNGRGIPSERLQRIFEPFYTTKAPGRGTGLGLSVCSRIIEQHNGRISVKSQVGMGSEFKVILPIS